MRYQDWQTKENRFVAMTGYTVVQFTVLLPYFQEVHDTYLTECQINGQKQRGLRRYVIYSNSHLPCMEGGTTFIRYCRRLNPIWEQQADLFGMERKQYYELVHDLRKILHRVLTQSASVPAQTDEELQEVLPDIGESDKLLLSDGTERDIPRPQDNDVQRKKYSGTKKKHTVKIADICYSIPSGFFPAQDTGYQNCTPNGITIIQSAKKPKGKKLTPDNQKISSFRVRVEHAVGSIKKCRIVKNECRLRKNKFVDNIFLTRVILHNFRLKYKPFYYENNLT
jgi:hypothetical protein